MYIMDGWTDGAFTVHAVPGAEKHDRALPRMLCTAGIKFHILPCLSTCRSVAPKNSSDLRKAARTWLVITETINLPT